MTSAQDFGQGISDAWNSIATFVPKLVGFLVILLIGWIIAKAVSKVVDKVLERVGFDRVVERGGIRTMMSRSKYDASDIIAKLIYYAILLVALQIAFGLFGNNPVSTMLTGIVAWLPRAAVAIVIIVVAGAIARAVKDLVGNALGGLAYGSLLGTLASVFVWGLGIIAALNQIGVATSVTTPVLITVLAMIGGIAIVGVGGGMVRPMQDRWERWLNRAEEEIPQAKAAKDAYQRGREDAARSTTGAHARQTEPASMSASQARTGGQTGGQTGSAGAMPRGPELPPGAMGHGQGQMPNPMPPPPGMPPPPPGQQPPRNF